MAMLVEGRQKAADRHVRIRSPTTTEAVADFLLDLESTSIALCPVVVEGSRQIIHGCAYSVLLEQEPQAQVARGGLRRPRWPDWRSWSATVGLATGPQTSSAW
jgi:hypothetical protein